VILVDTSVWIDFLQGRESARPLAELLDGQKVFCHPWIFGEMMMGHLKGRRSEILGNLKVLPQLPVYEIQDLANFLEKEKLYGLGLSLVDLQLLYSSLLKGSPIWTHDGSLHRAAKRYGKDYHFS
jgi:hypothetical protein